jgi:hypothetical protein
MSVVSDLETNLKVLKELEDRKVAVLPNTIHSLEMAIEWITFLESEYAAVHGCAPVRIKHKKGGLYNVVANTARVQTDVPLQDYDEVAVYKSLEDGKVWVRRECEMNDGRFTPFEPDIATQPKAIHNDKTDT